MVGVVRAAHFNVRLHDVPDMPSAIKVIYLQVIMLSGQYL